MEDNRELSEQNSVNKDKGAEQRPDINAFEDDDFTVVMTPPETFDGEEEETVQEAQEQTEPAPVQETEQTGYAPAAEDGAQEYGLPADHPGMGELRERIEERRRYSKKKQKRFRTRFYIIICSIVLLIAGFIFSVSGFFTVDSIEVQGNSHYTAEEIINMAHATAGRNILYNDGGDEMEEYLEQNPYIKKATVTRRLPSTLVIKVKERTERMAFKYDDDYLLMDESGILLKKTRNEPMVTIVEGNIVSKIKLGERIGTEDDELMKQTTDLIKTMIASDMYFVRVDMSDRKQVRAYIYDTLVARADYDTLMENLKNDRLHQVVEKLFADGIKRGTITFTEDGMASFMPII